MILIQFNPSLKLTICFAGIHPNVIVTHLVQVRISGEGRDSSVGIATRLRAGWTGFSIRQRQRKDCFYVHHRVPSGCGVYPTSNTMDTGGPFIMNEAAGREADHSLPSNVEMKNIWI